MRAHIFYDFIDGPWGGGNQFLKALKKGMDERNVSCSFEGADVLYVNSHHFGSAANLKKLLKSLISNPRAILIHRMDGPVTLIRDYKDTETDKLIFEFNKLFATATIFQSQWCFQNCEKLGYEDSKPKTIIYNAPDPRFFFPKPHTVMKNKKFSIVATSWSSSPNKGFSIYNWMDRHLDWNKFEMTFIGNTAEEFKNIRHVQPLSSDRLGEALRQHDIFITASKSDPCSNSLIEALHCGLPALAYHDGGHPELVGQGGLTFKDAEEIPALLEKITRSYETYRAGIALPSIEETVQSYLEFGKQLKNAGAVNNRSVTPGDVNKYVKKYRHYNRPVFKAILLEKYRNLRQSCLGIINNLQRQ